jgi:nitroreductase
VTATAVRGLTVREAAERRRSIREYDPAPVPRADLEELLRIAGLAPSAFNLQPWRFVVVEDRGLKAQVAAAAGNQKQIGSAPAVIVLYTDTTDAFTTREQVLHPDHAPERRDRARLAIERAFASKSDADRETWGAAQGYLALGYLLLAATAAGYQTSPMLGFNAEAVKTALGLPAHVRVPALVAIGRGIEDGMPHHRHPLDRIASFR